MKKLAALTLIGTTTSLMAMYAEHAYLYKDPRIMGMGGANVAVGGYSTSLFSNPAGLAAIQKDHGFVVDLLGIGVSASKSAQDFIDDIDAVPEDDTQAMSELLKKYSGEHFHIGVDNFSAISKNSDAFAWSIGLLAAADLNFMAHGNGSTMGELLETSSRAYGGIVAGVAKPYDTDFGKFDVGVGLKYVSQKSYEGTLGINELVDDGQDLTDKLKDRYEQSSSGMGVDVGVNYYPFPDNAWHPTIGLSILNIGSMSMDDNYGGQPMTVNLGASVSKELDYIDRLILAIDYVDLLNANVVRTYNYNSTDDTVVYTDYEENDPMKRLRLGAALGLVDSQYFSMMVMGGYYNQAYTAGVDLELTVLKLNVATYQEQIGTGGVDISDRRYMVKLGIGW